MMIELKKNGLSVEQQFPVSVFYENIQVGDYYADLFVNNEVVVELKAVENLTKQHEVQVVNYLNGISHEIGLLIHFGTSVTVKRKYRKYN